MRTDPLTPALSRREREKTGAIFNTVHKRSPRPFGERVRVRGNVRTAPKHANHEAKND
ncbi:hypothetical protein EsCd1HHP049_04882 [Escherichia sp. HH154_1D]|nr:hypothetical protein EsCdI10290_05012 [Escherichia sp. 10290]BDI43796.1 hypothetical protein EsCd1HHP024_04952 [Escherichia sp. HH091_1A]BDI48691.1 hypothetical protein EsCd1HHP049_04882 [Escherichia sp. HH154_1D]